MLALHKSTHNRNSSKNRANQPNNVNDTKHIPQSPSTVRKQILATFKTHHTVPSQQTHNSQQLNECLNTVSAPNQHLHAAPTTTINIIPHEHLTW
eukprot:gene13171-9017_t